MKLRDVDIAAILAGLSLGFGVVLLWMGDLLFSLLMFAVFGLNAARLINMWIKGKKKK